MLLWVGIVLLISLARAQSCQPQYVMPHLLRDTLQLSGFVNDQGKSVTTRTQSYSLAIFSTTPVLLLSIAGFSINGYTLVDYLLSGQVISSSLIVRLSSGSMNWQKTTLNYILHSLNDLFSTTTLISVSGNSHLSVRTQKTVVKTVVCAHNILGVTAAYASEYLFSVEGATKGENCEIRAYSNVASNFTVQTIYFDFSQKNFAYGYQQFSFQTTTAPQFRTVWMEFAPVVNYLMGFSSLSLTASTLQLSLALDQSSNLLTISGSPSVPSFTSTVFGLGQPSDSVCSPCGNFVTLERCLDICPSGSFGHSFLTGGKTCLQCFSQMSQIIGTKGCTCPSGSQYYQGNCYPLGSQPTVCPSGQSLFGTICIGLTSVLNCSTHSSPSADGLKCECDSGYELVTEECLLKCPEHGKRTNSGLCYCEFGYIMNASQLCQSICPANSIYRQDFQQCVCNYNYQMVNGFCKQCLPGLVYDPASSKCLAAFFSKAGDNSVLSLCRPNEVSVNGICQCDSVSINMTGRCVPCPPSTFKQGNQCQICSSFCQTCSNTNDCSKCQTGFLLTGLKCVQICGDGRRFVVQCDDGNTVNGDGCSSTCTVETGFTCYGGSSISTDICQRNNPSQSSFSLFVAKGSPQYTSSAILIDLKLTPAKARSERELHSLFNFAFNPIISRAKMIFLSSNSYDPTDIRCVLEYENNLPNDPFSVTISASDQNSRATVVVQIDTIANSKPMSFYARRIEDDHI